MWTVSKPGQSGSQGDCILPRLRGSRRQSVSGHRRTVNDPRKATAVGALRQLTGRNGLDSQRARQTMWIVAGQKNDLPGAHLDRRLSVDPDQQLPFDDDAKGQKMRWCRQKRRRRAGFHIGGYAPRSRQSGVKEDTTNEMNGAQNIRKRIIRHCARGHGNQQKSENGKALLRRR